MEPHDFDKLIKSRVQQANDIYQKEMEAAKPFVWSAVQNNLSRTNHITRWHLVAAVMVIVMVFTLVFHSSQQKHRQALDLLYTKMDQLQEHYHDQTNLLQRKEMQLDSVRDQLNQVVLHTENLPEIPKSPGERPMPKADTVFIRQIEYITAEPELEVASESVPEKGAIPSAIAQNSSTKVNEIDHVIFPSQKSSINNQRAEAIKVKFGSFTARKD